MSIVFRDFIEQNFCRCLVPRCQKSLIHPAKMPVDGVSQTEPFELEESGTSKSEDSIGKKHNEQ